jgi:hypothetical protein
MATERQIEANRRNALLSTGPKSDDGKERSRGNAITHGLTSTILHPSSESSATFAERKEQWAKEIRPRTDEAKFALDRAVVASFRMEQCEAAFDAMVTEHANRALDDWDGDRQLDAVRLLDTLPKKPALIAAQLESTPQGCDLKMMLWNSLGETVDTVGSWTDAQTSLALDLLGIPSAIRTGPTAIDPRGGRDVVEHRRDLALSEFKRLSERKAELGSLDDLRRRQAARGASAMLTPAAALLHRYERDACRRFQAAIRVAKAKPQPEEVAVEISDVVEEIDAEEPPDLEPVADPTVPISTPSDRLSHLNRRQRLALRSQERRA